MQFEELSQFETLLLIVHFHKHKVYLGKQEKQSQMFKKLKKKEVEMDKTGKAKEAGF